MIHWHMALDIQGHLMNARFPEQYERMLKHPDGRPMSPDEARYFLYEQLKQGKTYLPFGACDNFDCQKGCLGHEDSPKAPYPWLGKVRNGVPEFSIDMAVRMLEACVEARAALAMAAIYASTGNEYEHDRYTRIAELEAKAAGFRAVVEKKTEFIPSMLIGYPVLEKGYRIGIEEAEHAMREDAAARASAREAA